MDTSNKPKNQKPNGLHDLGQIDNWGPLKELHNINHRSYYSGSATYSQGARIACEYDQLWNAELTVQKFHEEIGLAVTAVIRDYYIDGPSGPALLVIVGTTGEGWRKGFYLAMVESPNDEPMFLIDDGETFAHIETICRMTNSRQWQYPWPKNRHMPAGVEYAEEAALNLLASH